jgi:hypothetical protein
MSLDAFVRCTCIRDGKAKPHPFPDRLTFDESGEPILTGDPDEDEWEAHDRWLAESCEHEGCLLSMFLGNITRVGNLRSFLRHLQGNPGPKFPILLEKVLYNGTHTGDWIPVKTIAGAAERSRHRAPLQRHSGRLGEGVLWKHEATVRGQHRDRESDYVLKDCSPRIHADQHRLRARC